MNDGKLTLIAEDIAAEKIEEFQDQPYVFGIYEKKHFMEMIETRPKWYEGI